MIKNFAVSLVFVLSMALPSLMAGQEVRFYVNSEEITTDDVLVVNVEVKGGKQMSSPRFPRVAGFRQVGTSNSQSFGSFGSKATFSATYVPQKTGTFSVPAFRYSVEGHYFQSPAFSIKVTEGTGKKKQQQSDPFGNFFNSPFDDLFKDPRDRYKDQQRRQLKEEDFKDVGGDYFLTLNLNTDTCYVGEQVFAEIAMYVNVKDEGKIQVESAAIQELQQRIKNQGFWEEQIQLNQTPIERVRINGEVYTKYTFYRSLLFPVKTGIIEFNDIFLDAKKLLVASSGSPFDAFFGRNTKYDPIKINAQKKSLLVKELPETDLPPTNSVGRFKMTAEVSDSVVNTGDILELKVKVKGNGNIAAMQEPILQINPAFEVDPPVSDFNVYKTEQAQYGEKTFTWSLVPTKHGNFDLGPINFYYFNPSEEVYDSLTIPGISVRIEGEDLENIVSKSSGLDMFYKNGIEDAVTEIKSKPFKGRLAIIGLLLLVLGSAAYGTVKYARSARPREEEEESGDEFWGK